MSRQAPSRSSKIIILTGARGVGKSTVCLKAASLARERGYTCGGLVTLSHPDGSREVLALNDGSSRPLTAPPGYTGKVVVQGRFRFLAETLTWGNELLATHPPCHLLVVDELGPLELERHGGWWRAIESLQAGRFDLGVAVVRPELVEKAQKALGRDVTVFTVTIANREQAPALLLSPQVGDLLYAS